MTIFGDFHAGLSQPTKGDIGFGLERAYLGYQYAFNEQWSAKVIFDMGRSSDVADIQRVGYLKNAMVAWTHGKFSLRLGVTGLTQFSLQEEFWGHRYVMKSFQDEHKMGSSTDLGMVAQYDCTPWLSVDVAIVNGEGYKKIQWDNHFLYALGLTLNPVQPLTLRFYSDYKSVEKSDSVRAQQNVAIFVGYEHNLLKMGAEYNLIFNTKSEVGHHQMGASAYLTLMLSKQFELYARYDYLTSLAHWNVGEEGQLAMVGMQYAPIKQIAMSPNVRLWIPREKGRPIEPFVYLNVRVKL